MLLTCHQKGDQKGRAKALGPICATVLAASPRVITNVW